MAIVCQLCQKTFDKIISGTHLKFAHSISGQEYKQRFGANSLACDEYRAARSAANKGENNPNFGNRMSERSRQSISQKNQGRIPHNKGTTVTDPDHLSRIRLAISKREQTYKEQNSHPRKGSTVPQHTREKISASIKQYAKDNPEELKERAAKAKSTLRNQGFDFGQNMRGKKHSEQSKQKIRESLKVSADRKHKHSLIDLQQAITAANLTFERMEFNRVFVKCNQCSNQFGITRQYFTNSKWRIDICAICRPIKVKSDAEIEILDFVRSLLPDQDVTSGDKHLIFPQEIDIVIPSKKIAIEYCGLYWHSELRGKHKLYHKYKMQNCTSAGYRLVTIFEDEWINNRDLVKSRLRAILGRISQKIFARNCCAKVIDTSTARDFCERHHLQGKGSASAAIGLYHQNQLVSVATFSRPNISKGARAASNKEVWELNRMCSLADHVVIGAANKMFKLFLQTHNPQQIITYCDLRWNTGHVYQTLGFEQVNQGFPNYWYFLAPHCKRIHRFVLRKTDKDDPGLTEWANRQQQGYDRIWDCGHSKWVWTKKAE